MKLQQFIVSILTKTNTGAIERKRSTCAFSINSSFRSFLYGTFFLGLNISTVFGQTTESIPENISTDTLKVIPQQITIDSTAVTDLAILPPSIVLLDTSGVKKKYGFLKRWFKDDYPSPKKATWMSLLLPGTGQIYNKDYWKLPIVYGAYAFGINNILTNLASYVDFRDAYIARRDQDPTTVDEVYTTFSDSDVKRFRDGFQTQMKVGFIILIGIHIIQTADAYVFAHLDSFDIDDDISLKIDPVIQYAPNNQSSVALNLSFHINSGAKEKPIPFFGR